VLSLERNKYLRYNRNSGENEEKYYTMSGALFGKYILYFLTIKNYKLYFKYNNIKTAFGFYTRSLKLLLLLLLLL